MTEQNLHKILNTVSTTKIVGNSNISILGIETDSRKIEKNFAFVAIKGVAVDGHNFINKAIELGANTIICETLPDTVNNNICYVQVADSSISCGELLREYYKINFNKLKVIGVTGTNGKTTTATLLYKLFTKLGNTCGLLSTVRNVVGNKEYAATHTTPDIIQLYKLLAQMQEAECAYCFMEVSSHAIHQNRTAGIDYTGGIFTNITQDHLDYHKTFAEYIQAKKKFFDNLNNQAFALSNFDDKNGSVMLQNTKASQKSYGLKGFADFKCKISEMHLDGMLLQIDGTEVWSRFLGAFNAYNILSVYATAIILEQDKQRVLECISMLTPADGRLEFFRDTEGKTAIVDYAHTPDALENVLSTLQKQQGSNEIITVVGCGGDRDRTKRPLMGGIAAKMSNRVIITADNPRSEEAADIAEEMLAGISMEDKIKTLTIIDRKEAIRTAIMLAKPNDLILIAGKGHEDYQEIKGVKHHFDDREIIKELFKL